MIKPPRICPEITRPGLLRKHVADDAQLRAVKARCPPSRSPPRLRLEITAHPRNADGFARVVGDRVSSIADIAEDTPFDPQPDLLSIDPPKEPLRSSVAGGRRERAAGVPKPTRNPWAGRKGSPHRKLKLRPKLSRRVQKVRQIGLAAPAGMLLLVPKTGRRDRLQDVGEYLRYTKLP